MVDYANEGKFDLVIVGSCENLVRKYILEGVFLGQGMNAQEAIEQIEKWKNRRC